MRGRGVSAALIAAWLMTPGSARAEPMGCAALVDLLGQASGYEVQVPSTAAVAGACQVEAPRFLSDRSDWPGLRADRLVIAGMAESGRPQAIEIDIAGLRLDQRLGSGTGDPRLREMFRLERADLRLDLEMDGDRLVVREAWLSLSGGATLRLSGAMAVTGLTWAEVLVGRVERLALTLVPEPGLSRRIMVAIGQDRDPDLSGLAAVRVAQEMMTAGALALPDAPLAEGSRAALLALIAGLPEERGVLDLTFAAEGGLGLGDVLVAGLADPPFAPEALARLLDGARIAATWRPGLQP